MIHSQFQLVELRHIPCVNPTDRLKYVDYLSTIRLDG